MYRFLLTFSCLALLTASTASGQTTVMVDPDGQASAASCNDPDAALTTIGAAIAAARNGDTVLVCPGTYVENINFGGKAITLRSMTGPAATIIDGNAAGSVVTFASNEDRSSILQGFTIRNGRASFDGGGIRVEGASPVIRGNVITANRACEAMGISSYFASPLIEDNTVAGNIQFGCTGGTLGGGILIGGESAAIVRRNRIYENAGVMDGGGIALNAAGTPTIELNWITRNSAEQGGGISLINSSNATIAGNLIVGNQARSGGGIYWAVPSGDRGPVVVNNTIAGNTGTQGSGIFSDGFDETTLVINNIITAPAGQAAVFCGDFTPGAPIFTSNDVFSASGPAYGGGCGNLTGVNGNVSADPQFAAAGDYHLLAGSPAIDAGSNGASGLPSVDFDGHARVIDGNSDALAIVDLGADEAAGTGTAPGPFAKTGPVNASAGQPLSVSLTWQPSAGATGYEYCYDLVDNGECDDVWTPAWNNTSATLPSLSAGATYYWQVRALNAAAIAYADGDRALFSSFTTVAASLRRTISLSGNLAFGGVMTGISATRTLTITNSGNAVLTVTAIFLPVGFSAAYSGAIAPGASRDVIVTFSPTVAAAYAGTVSVVGDQTDGIGTIPASGTGLTPPPVNTSSFLIDTPSPLSSGRTVTFTATAFGGNGNLEYEFWRYSVATGVWTMVQPYGTNRRYWWTPADRDAGTYHFQVWVRSSGSQALYEAWMGLSQIEVRVPAPTLNYLSCSPSGAVDIGTRMYCGASASGGTDIDYRFWHYTGATATWSMLSDYGGSSSVSWTADAGGTDYVQVWVRNRASSATYQDWRSTAIQVLNRGLSLSAPTTYESLPAVAGTSLYWSVTATGGVVPTQFQFWLYSATAGTWTLLRDYSASNSASWRPMEPGTYAIQVWARGANSTKPYEAWSATPMFTITPNVVTALSLAPNVNLPVTVGTPVTWSAQAYGGFGSLQYRFCLYDETTGWSVARDYSYSSYWTWTPSHPGRYSVQVWVRDSGSTAPYDAWLGTSLFEVR